MLEMIMATQEWDVYIRVAMETHIKAILLSLKQQKQSPPPPPEAKRSLFLALFGGNRCGKRTILRAIEEAAGFGCGTGPFKRIEMNCRLLCPGPRPADWVEPTQVVLKSRVDDPSRQKYIDRYSAAWNLNDQGPLNAQLNLATLFKLRDGVRQTHELDLADFSHSDVTLPSIILLEGDDSGVVKTIFTDERVPVEADPDAGIFVFTKPVPLVQGNSRLDEILLEEFLAWMKTGDEHSEPTDHATAAGKIHA